MCKSTWLTQEKLGRKVYFREGGHYDAGMTADRSSSEKIVYLMRGLPCCGKSHTARRLAGQSGVICETDEYFHTRVGSNPAEYDYRKELLPLARKWNFERFRQAVAEGRSPIVVDRGNSLDRESHQYAKFAADHGYRVELAEPDSAWWQEIRVLLKYKSVTRPILYGWAKKLAEMSQAHHRVPESTIRRWMDHWRWDVTIDDILHFEPPEREPGGGHGRALTRRTVGNAGKCCRLSLRERARFRGAKADSFSPAFLHRNRRRMSQ